MAATSDRQRRPRTDKQRNRAHILEVADELFTEQGVAGSMDAIAKRAGVGPGTLYRHFPNREALIAGLLQARNDELDRRRERIHQEVSDPGAALEQWLDVLFEWATAFDGLPEPLRLALSETASPLAFTCQGFVTMTEDFLSVAREEGAAREGVRGRDLFLGVLAAAWASSAVLADESSPRALRDLLRDGWAADLPGEHGQSPTDPTSHD